jgi:hypothetical protein
MEIVDGVEPFLMRNLTNVERNCDPRIRQDGSTCSEQTRTTVVRVIRPSSICRDSGRRGSRRKSVVGCRSRFGVLGLNFFDLRDKTQLILSGMPQVGKMITKCRNPKGIIMACQHFTIGSFRGIRPINSGEWKRRDGLCGDSRNNPKFHFIIFVLFTAVREWG